MARIVIPGGTGYLGRALAIDLSHGATMSCCSPGGRLEAPVGGER